jgi:hypothetical protein
MRGSPAGTSGSSSWSDERQSAGSRDQFGSGRLTTAKLTLTARQDRLMVVLGDNETSVSQRLRRSGGPGLAYGQA